MSHGQLTSKPAVSPHKIFPEPDHFSPLHGCHSSLRHYLLSPSLYCSSLQTGPFASALSLSPECGPLKRQVASCHLSGNSYLRFLLRAGAKVLAFVSKALWDLITYFSDFISFLPLPALSASATSAFSVLLEHVKHVPRPMHLDLWSCVLEHSPQYPHDPCPTSPDLCSTSPDPWPTSRKEQPPIPNTSQPLPAIPLSIALVPSALLLWCKLQQEQDIHSWILNTEKSAWPRGSAHNMCQISEGRNLEDSFSSSQSTSRICFAFYRTESRLRVRRIYFLLFS